MLEQVEEISQLDNVHIANNEFNWSRKLNEERLAYLILIVKLILPSSLPEQKLVSLQNHLHHFVCTSWFIRLKWELRTNNPKWQYPKIFDSRRIGILFDPDVDFSDQNRWQSWPITGWTGFLSLAASNETNGTEIWILVIQIILELLRPLIQFSKISGVFNVIWQNVGWSTGEQIYRSGVANLRGIV